LQPAGGLCLDLKATFGETWQQLLMGDWNLQEWKMTDEIAGV